VSLFRPEVSHVVEIHRPPCPKCGTLMFIVRIHPDEKPDHDQRTFECPDCKHEEIRIVKYRENDPTIRCSKCKVPMRLILLEPDGPNSEIATYFCETCAVQIKGDMVWRYYKK
jgi:predicted RNA-binding Zn-ribbon protein involved in translation (DUF1610 family)